MKNGHTLGWWHVQREFWDLQARLCGMRGDAYRAMARNCDFSVMQYRPLQPLELYCEMQARSCDTQQSFCRMVASLVS